MDASISARVEWQEYKRLAPDAHAATVQLSSLAEAHGLDKGLLELVRLRASQINGCAFCVAWHVREALKLRVSAEKLHLVAVWRDSPSFSVRERAALTWAEALTTLGVGVPDEVYALAGAAFSPAELAYLTSAVLAINALNRLSVAYRFTPLPIHTAA